MQELRRYIVTAIKPLHRLDVVLLLAWGKSLLPVDCLVFCAHVIHDCNFGMHLTLAGPAPLQKSLDLGLILRNVVIKDVLNAINVVLVRVVKVMSERKCSSLKID